jgi:clan AA aspartic protease
MSTFNVAIQLGDLSGEQFVQAEALVDTGSTYSMFPQRLLAQLGVEPTEWRRFQVAEDRIVERQVGDARIRLAGVEHITLVIFDPENTEPLIGAVTLETFGLAVDPVGQHLIPVPGRL